MVIVLIKTPQTPRQFFILWRKCWQIYIFIKKYSHHFMVRITKW